MELQFILSVLFHTSGLINFIYDSYKFVIFFKEENFIYKIVSYTIEYNNPL